MVVEGGGDELKGVRSSLGVVGHKHASDMFL